VFSTVYFRFRNYRNTGAVFVFENTVPLSFLMKKYESKSGGVFRRPFPTVFIPNQQQQKGFSAGIYQFYLVLRKRRKK